MGLLFRVYLYGLHVFGIGYLFFGCFDVVLCSLVLFVTWILWFMLDCYRLVWFVLLGWWLVVTWFSVVICGWLLAI